MSVFLQKVMRPLRLDSITRRSRKKSTGNDGYTVTPIPSLTHQKKPTIQGTTNEEFFCGTETETLSSPGKLRRKGTLRRWSSVSTEDEDTSYTRRKERLDKLQDSIVWLRKELIEMRAMDQLLARQLMDIRRTIYQLKLEDCETGQEQMEEFDSTITYQIPSSQLDTIHELGENQKGIPMFESKIFSKISEKSETEDIDELFVIAKTDLTFDLKQMFDVCL